jgi:hypothetical protein
MSQSRMVESPAPLANVRLSGAKATLPTQL